MTNLEKYFDKIVRSIRNGDSFACAIREEADMDCMIGACKECQIEMLKWLMKEYEVEWTKVKKGTPVLVRGGDTLPWEDARFIAYVPELAPASPFVAIMGGNIENWRQCKLKE